MKVRTTEIPGALIVEPKIHGDQRGFFTESYNQLRYQQAGIEPVFVQDNLSYSQGGVLRGLHFQNPNPQGKLVQVLTGAVFDVVVDIRHGSPAFGRWVGVELSDRNKQQFYIPPGCAHGFCVLSDAALFAYKCTALYSPEGDGSIAWDDPDIGVKWPVSQPVLSSKDKQAPRLRDIPAERLLPFGSAELV